jgi:DNA topoisomerase-3
MSPTLALIVEREKEITSFVKEPFYTVEIDCHSFTASGDRHKDRQAAENIKTVCDGKTARVISVEEQEKSMLPPKLYDLTTLQREANRLHGFTSQQTLDYVQSLYEKKLSTYPRTDSKFLTEDMAAELPALVYAVAGALPFTKNLSPFVDVKRVIDNKKVTDHHAIIPTQTMIKTDLSSLPAGEREIMHMIAVRLICAVGDRYVYNETTVTVDCENHVFKAKGKNVLKDGWKAVEQVFKAALKNKPDEDSEDDKALPKLSKGQTFDSVRAELREGFTSPPKRFTEDTLLSAMECAGDFSEIPDAERKGLGTPATRAAIIEKLVKTGFIERKEAKKVKTLLPTEKGVNLIAVLPEIIKSPALTADWEGMLKQIERGEFSDVSFMAGIAEMTKDLVKNNSAPKSEYTSLFGSPKQTQGKTVGVCPRCNNNIREGGKGFFCDNKACKFVLWKDNKFFVAKKKKLTAEIAAALLKDGRVAMTGLYSEKSGKTYNATIILDDTGEKWVNFKMEFEKGGK